MTSHSKTLLPISPQLMPGMSLSLCINLSWRLKSPEAAELAMMLCSVPSGVALRSEAPDGKVDGPWSREDTSRKASNRVTGWGFLGCANFSGFEIPGRVWLGLLPRSPAVSDVFVSKQGRRGNLRALSSQNMTRILVLRRRCSLSNSRKPSDAALLILQTHHSSQLLSIPRTVYRHDSPHSLVLLYLQSYSYLSSSPIISSHNDIPTPHPQHLSNHSSSHSK